MGLHISVRREIYTYTVTMTMFDRRIVLGPVQQILPVKICDYKYWLSDSMCGACWLTHLQLHLYVSYHFSTIDAVSNIK